MVLRAGSLGSVATPPAVSAARGHLAYVVQTIRLSRETSARHPCSGLSVVAVISGGAQ
jgi:hypothetical protein